VFFIYSGPTQIEQIKSKLFSKCYCIFYRNINHYCKYINVGTISIFIPILLYFGCSSASSITVISLYIEVTQLLFYLDFNFLMLVVINEKHLSASLAMTI